MILVELDTSSVTFPDPDGLCRAAEAFPSEWRKSLIADLEHLRYGAVMHADEAFGPATAVRICLSVCLFVCRCVVCVWRNAVADVTILVFFARCLSVCLSVRLQSRPICIRSPQLRSMWLCVPCS